MRKSAESGCFPGREYLLRGRRLFPGRTLIVVTEARSGWPPEDEYPEVAQSGWPPEDEYLEETRSPRVELVDVVARLQKELEEFRAKSGYGSAKRWAIPAQTSGGSGFTSTSVPMYAGKSSWDQFSACV